MPKRLETHPSGESVEKRGEIRVQADISLELDKQLEVLIKEKGWTKQEAVRKGLEIICRGLEAQKLGGRLIIDYPSGKPDRPKIGEYGYGGDVFPL